MKVLPISLNFIKFFSWLSFANRTVVVTQFFLHVIFYTILCLNFFFLQIVNKTVFQLHDWKQFVMLIILIEWVLYVDFKNSGFPGGSDGKESACNEGDLGLIPGLGRSSILAQRIPMDRGAWWDIVHGVTKKWTQLSN